MAFRTLGNPVGGSAHVFLAMDDTRVTLNPNDIEILEDQEDLAELIDAMTNELQRVPRVRAGRRFLALKRHDEVTARGGRHRTWTPAGRR